jgi:hypothetical protein
MTKTKVYEINRCVNIGTEDVYGEMLRKNEDEFYFASKLNNKTEVLGAYEYKKTLKQDINIHKELYPWYSGFAWNNGDQEPVDYLLRSMPFKHKSYVIAMRGE